MNALENLTGATVYLHPREVAFTATKKIIIGCVISAAITLLVVGILAVTHGIMPTAAYALIGIGGVGMLATAIACAFFGVQHYKAIKPILTYIQQMVGKDGSAQWWSAIFESMKPEHGTPIDQIKNYTTIICTDEGNEPEIYLTVIKNGENRFIHIYLYEPEWAMQSDILDLDNYAYTEFENESDEEI